MTPSVARAKSGRTHLKQQERKSSKKGAAKPLAAPPVDYAVRSPDGAIIHARAYDWRRGDILVYGEAA